VEQISVSPCDSRVLAKLLLDAWLARDRSQVLLRIEQIGSAPLSGDPGVETERFDILKAVAVRMRLTPNLFEMRGASPKVESWIDLLNHFSKPVEYLPGGSGGRQRPQYEIPVMTRLRPSAR